MKSIERAVLKYQLIRFISCFDFFLLLAINYARCHHFDWIFGVEQISISNWLKNGCCRAKTKEKTNYSSVQTCEWNGLCMRRASLRPLAACEKTTNAGDGKCADPYSEPSMAIGFQWGRIKWCESNKLFANDSAKVRQSINHFRLQYDVADMVLRFLVIFMLESQTHKFQVIFFLSTC